MNKVLIFTPHFFPEKQILNDLVFSLNKELKFIIVTSFPNYPDRKLFKEYKFFRSLYCSKYKNIKIIRLPVIYRKKNNKFFLFLNYLTYVLSSLILLPTFLFIKFDKIFIYLTSPFSVTLAPFILSLCKRMKLNIWVLDLWPETLLAYNFRFKNFIIKSIFSYTQIFYTKCENIFVSSLAYSKSKSLINFKKKITFVPQWIINIDKVKLKYPYALPRVYKNDFIILFSGNIGKAQNLDQLFKTIKSTQLNKKIKWFFVGDGSEKDYFQKKVEKHNLLNIHFFGHIPYEQLNVFYEKANAYLISLVDSPAINKVLPAKLQHYLIYGKPILTLSSGEISDFVYKNKIGFVAKSNDHSKLSENIIKLTEANEKELGQIKIQSKKLVNNIFDKNLNLNKIKQKAFL